MASNNRHGDSEQLMLLSGFRRQMIYISVISLAVVAYTFGEISFSKKHSHYSSVTTAQRGFIKSNDDDRSMILLGSKYKLATSESVNNADNLDTHTRTNNNNKNNTVHQHSRVVCLDGEGCSELNDEKQLRSSWGTVRDNSSSKRLSSSSSDGIRDKDGNKCELSDPSYQAKLSAPSTCNSVHELAFDMSKIRYLAKGAFKMAWEIELSVDEHYVMKTVVFSKIKSSSSELDKNTRDALIMEHAGKAPDSYQANVLAMYQYCAVTSLVPFASKQPLDKYIKGKILSAKEMYHLALQAARGLYQMQSYRDGYATYAHADVKPAQFLLFDSPQDSEDNFPLLQLNDFNRGKYIKRSVSNKEPCAFRMCDVHHKGSTYRSPEEYMDCADQSAAIDVFSLGSVFFFLLSNGLKPYFQRSFDSAVEGILHGRLPKLPDANDCKKYLYYSEDKAEFASNRSKQPLFVALQDVMKKCWSFKPEDRPTSLQVVQMLEAKLDNINEEA